jgi:hypothetical protein
MLFKLLALDVRSQRLLVWLVVLQCRCYPANLMLPPRRRSLSGTQSFEIYVYRIFDPLKRHPEFFVVAFWGVLPWSPPVTLHAIVSTVGKQALRLLVVRGISARRHLSVVSKVSPVAFCEIYSFSVAARLGTTASLRSSYYGRVACPVLGC